MLHAFYISDKFRDVSHSKNPARSHRPPRSLIIVVKDWQLESRNRIAGILKIIIERCRSLCRAVVKTTSRRAAAGGRFERGCNSRHVAIVRNTRATITGCDRSHYRKRCTFLRSCARVRPALFGNGVIGRRSTSSPIPN